MAPIAGKKIVITGGTGFIATHVAKRLADQNLLTLLGPRLEGAGFESSGLKYHPNVTRKICDLTIPNQIEETLGEPDIIIHTAGFVGVQKVIQQSMQAYAVNLIGTQNLLATLADPVSGKVKRKLPDQFVNFSTSEVMGGAAYLCKETDPAMIGSSTEPRWIYAMSKLATEHICGAYHRTFNLPTVNVRPFNVYGPYRTGGHAMKVFISAALRREPITVHGDGAQLRAWCYVDDFVDGMMLLLNNPQATGRTYQIGNPACSITMRSLAFMVKSVLSSGSEVVFIPKDYADMELRIPDVSKAVKELGYSPKVSLEEGILLAAESYR